MKQVTTAILFAMLAAVTARADNVWTFLAAGETGNPSSDYPCIVQGEWALLANSISSLGNDIAHGKYRVGKPLAWPANGVLDLRNMSIAGYPGTDGAIAVTNLTFGNNNNDQYGGNPCAVDSPIVELYASHIAAHQMSPWGYYSDNLRRVWFESDYITEFGGFFPSCTNVVFRFPNWTAISRTYQLGTGLNTSAARLSCNDISDVIPPTLQYFNKPIGLANGATGKLVLPNVQFSNTSLVPDSIEEAEITYYGDTLYNTPLFNGAKALKDLLFVAPNCTNMYFHQSGNQAYVWNGVTSLTNVTFDIPKVETSFYWPACVRTATFWSQAPAKEVVQEMFKNMNNTQNSNNPAKLGTIYASRKMGWGSIGELLTETEEASEYKPDKCMGVLVGSTGTRLAWLVHRQSPHEPNGTVFFMR